MHGQMRGQGQGKEASGGGGKANGQLGRKDLQQIALCPMKEYEQQSPVVPILGPTRPSEGMGEPGGGTNILS